MADTDDVNNDSSPQPGAVIMPGSPAAAPTEPLPEETPMEPPAPSPFALPGQELAAPQGEAGTISWAASEFIAHDKTASWYLALAGAVVLCAALVYLITKDEIASVVILVAGLTLGVFGARRPKQIGYRLDGVGISVGEKHFVYDSFRSFTVVAEGAFSSIVFIPLKRFGLPLTIYYAPDDEQRIVDILADRLPLENRPPDPVDNFMRRIRF